MRKKNHDTANGEYQYARPKTSVPMLGLGMASSKSNPSLMRVNSMDIWSLMVGLAKKDATIKRLESVLENM